MLLFFSLILIIIVVIIITVVIFVTPPSPAAAVVSAPSCLCLSVPLYVFFFFFFAISGWRFQPKVYQSWNWRACATESKARELEHLAMQRASNEPVRILRQPLKQHFTASDGNEGGLASHVAVASKDLPGHASTSRSLQADVQQLLGLCLQQRMICLLEAAIGNVPRAHLIFLRVVCTWPVYCFTRHATNALLLFARPAALMRTPQTALHFATRRKKPSKHGNAAQIAIEPTFPTSLTAPDQVWC